MTRRRRFRATSLLLMTLATISFGVCAAMLPPDGKLPCCPDLLPGESALTPCCGTGEQPATAVHTTPQAPGPAASLFAVDLATRSLRTVSPRDSIGDSPARPGDRQALLSTFLI